MRFLVTGGAGFIGSHLVDSLLQQGHDVSVLDDLSSGKRENLPAAVRFIEGSILDNEAVAKAMAGCNGCYHLAAIASVTRSMEEWPFTHAVNQSGAVNVFDAAAKAGLPVVYASSAAVYGANEDLPLEETQRADPLSPYGLDKLACEWQARIGLRALGLHAAGMRFFNVYGPRQDPASPYSGVISIFMQRLKDNEEITIFGDGEQTRDFIYVGDVVAHLEAAMTALLEKHIQCEVFNVCTGIQTSVKELAITLRDSAKRDVLVSHREARAGDIRLSCGNPAHAIATLGLRSKLPLKEGLLQTWRAFVDSSA